MGWYPVCAKAAGAYNASNVVFVFAGEDEGYSVVDQPTGMAAPSRRDACGL